MADSHSSYDGAGRRRAPAAGAEDQTAAVVLGDLVRQAVSAKATDIHLEAEENGPRLRFRVNGILYEFPAPPAEIYPNIVARLKVLSDMDVSERRVPQSSYYSCEVSGRRVDMRVSTFPSIFGECVSIRVLDRANITLGFDRLGFPPAMIAKYQRLLVMPYGMILVTGPTGGGKTTTLYASLNKLGGGRRKIITLEDPVEYHIAGVTQGQINPKAGFTFAEGLRSILRQDPNVVMVGEIRDAETAATAMQISLTGQMVFATLHTNSAPGVVTRLLDMDVEPYLVSSSLLGVLNQTLVRHVCQKCLEEYEPEPSIREEAADELGEIGDRITFRRGRGCADCNQSGFQGRIGLYELMEMKQETRELVMTKPSVEQVMKLALASGMKTLRRDGLEKAAAGIVTIEDVIRVTRSE